jgi:plasmid stability protein
MAQVLVRDLDDKVVERLKVRAQRRGRSLQVELKTILEQAASSDLDLERAKRLAAKLRRELAGRKHSDSGELQAEDRRR